MSVDRFRSLQLRLAVRLAILYVVAAAIAVAILGYQAYETAGSLNDRELDLRAEDLARAMVTDSAGQPRLNLPSKLAASYTAAPEDDLFAIRDANAPSLASAYPNGLQPGMSRAISVSAVSVRRRSGRTTTA